MNALNLYLCVLLALGVTAHPKILIDPETEQGTQCGGAIEANSGSLTYPVAGQVVEASATCIWTIHLQNTRAVSFNFSNLDIIGNDPDCGDSGVRLYSLSNLIPADKSKNFTFCNNQPPTDASFLLLENLIAVIYHSSENTIIHGTGFTVNWEGISFEPTPKIHHYTFTSETMGLIRYPVVGGYLPNQISTWVVETSEENADLQLHISIPYVCLEFCRAEDPCVCDALILYEVTRSGVLREEKRLCGNATGTEIEGVGPNFIAGFFTDGERVGGSGTGFELIYRPSTESSTAWPTETTERTTEPSEWPTETTEWTTEWPTETTEWPTETTEWTTEWPTETTEWTTEWPTETTEWTTETTEWPTETTEWTTGWPTEPTDNPSSTETAPPTTSLPPISNSTTSCGGALLGNVGLISYKLQEMYSSWERCPWTVRVPFNSAIRFTINLRNLENPYDYITFYSINLNGTISKEVEVTGSASPVTFEIQSPVALISFHSDGSGQYNGFSIAFQAVGDFDDAINDYEDFNVVASTTWHSLKYPAEGPYSNQELSTFVFSRHTDFSNYVVALNFLALNLESNTGCIDTLNVYTTAKESRHLVRRSPTNGWCSLSQVSTLPRGTDSVIIVLATNEQGRSDGFQVEWRQYPEQLRNGV